MMSNEKAKTKLCKHCKTEIPAGAKICPNCRKKQGGMVKWIIIALVVLVIFAALSGGKDNTSDTDKTTETSPNTTPGTEIESQTAERSISTTSAIAETVTQADDDGVPTEYKSALNKAKDYSDIMSMSKAAIYDQLTSEYGEKFSPEAAQYAIDNVKANWNANALKKGTEYSDTMYMSKAGIYDQLISEYGEKFTEEEAQYAVDNIKADWNDNALKKAKDYQDSMDMSPAAIRDQLTSEYGEKFTAEEADYAIEHLE